jgi:undecaprenyl diphosphate synthase
MNPLKHVAIIMDGNGRWGLKKKKSRNYGHQQGLKVAEKIITHSIKKNIKFLTLYVFSTENWSRPLKEKKFLFNMLESFLKKKLDYINRQNIKIKILGVKNFSTKLNKLLTKSEKKTFSNNRLQINLAINYGSKKELIDTFTYLKKKNIKFNEFNINKNLYTKNIPDPDLLIRTGDTNRLSNFLLWQLAYTEIFFEKKLWPDFDEDDFDYIINKFKKIKRKFGGIS